MKPADLHKESQLLMRVRLTEAHNPTGKTKHYHGDTLLPSPVELRVVQYRPEPGYYLFYCNAEGQELTDTYHDSIEEAQTQAEWEFSVKASEWESVGANGDGA